MPRVAAAFSASVSRMARASRGVARRNTSFTGRQERDHHTVAGVVMESEARHRSRCFRRQGEERVRAHSSRVDSGEYLLVYGQVVASHSLLPKIVAPHAGAP